MEEGSNRTSGAKSAAVLERLAERRTRSVSLKDDRDWLAEISSDPEQLIADMAARALLYRVGAGRYVLAQHGTFTPEQVASPEFLAAVRLRSRGEYFFSYLTALIAYRLTDVHSTNLFVAVPGRGRSGVQRVESYSLRIVRLSESIWPSADELLRVRAFESSREFIWRAQVERALLDALTRPEYSGGFDHVVECWGRARRADVDWDRVCVIALRQMDATRRRAEFMLRLLGLHEVADRHFAARSGRGQSVALDRTRSFESGNLPPERDKRTGVLLNVPRTLLDGWADASAFQ